MLNLCQLTRSKRYRMGNNNEVVEGRGLRVFRRDAFTLEEQKIFATRYHLCPRHVGGRICGKALGFHSGTKKRREHCGMGCTPLPDTVGEDEFFNKVKVPLLITAGPSIHTASTYTPPEMQEEGPSEDDQVTVSDASTECSFNDLELTPLREMFEITWNATHTQRTRMNNKSNLKLFLEIHGKRLYGTWRDECSVQEFVDILGSPETWPELVQEFRNNPNTLRRMGTVKTMAEVCGQIECAEYLGAAAEGIKNETDPTLIGDERRKIIEAIAEKVDCDLGGDQPGVRLLDAIQQRLGGLIPKNSTETCFWFDQVFGFFFPCLRGVTTSIEWGHQVPRDFKRTNRNICVVRNGSVAGLYCGMMKFQNSQRFQKWKTRIYLDEKGVHTHDGRCFIPCHMNQDEWELLMTQFTGYMDELYQNQKTGQRVWRTTNLNKMAKTYWGVQFGCQVRRIIFRNGVQIPDEDFIVYVMQHSEATDVYSYVKPCLMHGPWSTNLVAEEDSDSE